MALPSVRLILNGKKAGLAPVRAAVAQTRERGVNVDVRVTWEAGDAARFAREAVEDETDGDLADAQVTVAASFLEELAWRGLPASIKVRILGIVEGVNLPRMP